ncbi:hypothetical protein HV337_12150 [Citrobacter freundii]|uniref:ZirU family protein n=1 Tax=Citrobacter freundii TaxID=546 RepID=UPI0015EAA1F7|nr:ZirU family protein [Citrobacter freundii]QLR73244.1 hypothetical protein HV337_12150 [Citrobacter freundii]
MKRKNFTLTASSAMLILSFPALAVLSDPTDTVKGRVPVITQSTIVSADTNSNGVFDIGDVISISQQGAFSDPDGDAESQRTFQWQADGADISGATSDTYTVTASDLGKKITVLVTPHTDPTITDPDRGIDPQRRASGFNRTLVERVGAVVQLWWQLGQRTLLDR